MVLDDLATAPGLHQGNVLSVCTIDCVSMAGGVLLEKMKANGKNILVFS